MFPVSEYTAIRRVSRGPRSVSVAAGGMVSFRQAAWLPLAVAEKVCQGGRPDDLAQETAFYGVT
jgi:hypothetical protein